MKGSIFTGEPSGNFLFASAVAEFGLLLRDSQYMGDASYRNVTQLAENAADDDLKMEFLGFSGYGEGLRLNMTPLPYPFPQNIGGRRYNYRRLRPSPYTSYGLGAQPQIKYTPSPSGLGRGGLGVGL